VKGRKTIRFGRRFDKDFPRLPLGEWQLAIFEASCGTGRRTKIKQNKQWSPAPWACNKPNSNRSLRHRRAELSRTHARKAPHLRLRSAAGRTQIHRAAEPHNVPIFDARLIAGNLSLDREGFALVRHPTIVKDFYDDKEVRSVYYPPWKPS
jgi:hypothetical protein